MVTSDKEKSSLASTVFEHASAWAWVGVQFSHQVWAIAVDTEVRDFHWAYLSTFHPNHLEVPKSTRWKAWLCATLWHTPTPTTILLTKQTMTIWLTRPAREKNEFAFFHCCTLNKYRVWSAKRERPTEAEWCPQCKVQEAIEWDSHAQILMIVDTDGCKAQKLLKEKNVCHFLACMGFQTISVFPKRDLRARERVMHCSLRRILW